MKQPCKTAAHFGFVIATSDNGNGQFIVAKELASNIFKYFAVTGSRAGATALKSIDKVDDYLTNNPASLRRKLDSLPNYSGSFSADQVATSVEEAILRLSTEAPKFANKIVVLIVDVKEFDMNGLGVIAPLMRRELAINNIKLFIVAVGSTEKSANLRSLTEYADEVLIKQRFDNMINDGLRTSIAIAICQLICEFCCFLLWKSLAKLQC